ncbi:MAG TPA: hypothetical protein VH277_18520 [Gemmatimonadaceae bacterium]|jgi:hypothetical protein|nr:hypothetical protein [Gemmatimonadaceae bacterium]
MNRARGLAALALLFVMPAAARAQACRTCQTEDTTPRGHIWPALGIHAGAPQKASAALGVVVGETWQRNGREHARNIALFAEPGLSAGRASIAYVDHGYGSFGSGFGVAATLLRTWNDPWVAKENVSYVGGEIILWPIVFTGPRVGVFRSVSGPAGSSRWFVGVDLGIGL